MNIFYAPSRQITGDHIELTDQEAQHATKVMRYREGDAITVVDGEGGWYEGTITHNLRATVHIHVDEQTRIKPTYPELTLAMGILKKRDRLEFAIEKAVELGAAQIILFRSKHTVKQNFRMDRLEATVLSAMKQSLRAFLPSISIYETAQEVVDNYPGDYVLVAHEKDEGPAGVPEFFKKSGKLLLMVGPEGGFSEEEISQFQDHNAKIISLGSNRLRAETAVVTFLSQFL